MSNQGGYIFSHITKYINVVETRLLAYINRSRHIPAQAWVTFGEINYRRINDIPLAIAAKLIDTVDLFLKAVC